MTERRVRVVGVGASAGGIEAFRGLFQAMPADSGLGFVVVLHLPADRKSLLPEILARWTAMPVAEAKDGALVEPNRVYVPPPGTVVELRHGRLRLRPSLQPDGSREPAPIDIFFGSLADDLGEDAVAVVLSGTGSDGALGLKAVKERGGLTLSQGTDGSAPEYHGMPDSAVHTGAVDLVVPVEQMPEHILRVSGRDEPRREPPGEDADAARLAICRMLLAQLGHDFSGYKENTFMRRVRRRMSVLNIASLDSYVARLEADHDQVVLLFRDLLIGVTSFFRDAETFAALERQVVPRLFGGKGAHDSVRVWVAGCATGEEAYSLGMLLREHMDGVNDAPRVQIFATDIDEPAIATARAGRYPAVLLDGLSPARRERFFRGHDGSYVVAKEVRELVTFSAHSLVRDPPFSRMDLVSCRNLLIYLDQQLQDSVMPAFHYSLAPGGVLLLGSSEAISRHEALFAPLDRPHRIFLRREGPSPPLHVAVRNTGGKLPVAAPRVLREVRPGPPRTTALANARVLERFAPAFVVANADGEVSHFSSRTGRFLEPATGAPSRSVLELARRGLRLPLREALRQAADTGRVVEHAGVAVEDAAFGPVTLVVEPLPVEGPDRLYLVVFTEEPPAPNPADEPNAETGEPGMVAHLERELSETKERLQSLTEEHETALEELRSSFEELQSVNEELQSTNSELEISREGLQTFNEELHTLNTQLTISMKELDRTNSDLRNLFESTQVATVFLDQYLVIRGFTPEVGKIYNLIPSDQGRPLTDIVSRLRYGGLREDVGRVLDTLEPLERRVTRLDDAAHYLMRILPYRAPDSTVDGSLITFVDVTGIVQAEEHQRLLVDELNHRVKNMLTVVISLATQTIRRSVSLEEFSGVFMGRVHALTAAYALLSRENWVSVTLRDVLEEELRPFMVSGRPNIVLDGPDVKLDPRGALALGMAIHELATNAVKYGALSVPEGDVAVTWDVQQNADGPGLALEWAERSGPAVAAPARRGFGTMLIERGLAHDLSGEARVEFRPEGVRATLRAPLRAAALPPGS